MGVDGRSVYRTIRTNACPISAYKERGGVPERYVCAASVSDRGRGKAGGCRAGSSAYLYRGGESCQISVCASGFY